MRKKGDLPALFLALFLAGQVFGSAMDDSAPPIQRLSMKQAKAIALRQAPGKVRDFEFKIWKEKWVYAFRVAGRDKRSHRVIVEAVTGKVLSRSSEPMPQSPKEGAVKSPPKK